MSLLVPDESYLILFWKFFFRPKSKQFRFSSGTSTATWRWRLPIIWLNLILKVPKQRNSRNFFKACFAKIRIKASRQKTKWRNKTRREKKSISAKKVWKFFLFRSQRTNQDLNQSKEGEKTRDHEKRPNLIRPKSSQKVKTFWKPFFCVPPSTTISSHFKKKGCSPWLPPKYWITVRKIFDNTWRASS